MIRSLPAFLACGLAVAAGFSSARAEATLTPAGARVQDCLYAAAETYRLPPAPASATPLAVAGSLYAAWVLTRRLTFPIRAPRSAGCRDHGLPDPATRKPRRASADIFIGNDQVSGQEIWITNEDARQHGTIPARPGPARPPPSSAS